MITTVFTAKEAKNNFGRLLDEARRFPVFVKKNGRVVVVIISIEKYLELKARQVAYLGKRDKRAEKKGSKETYKNATFLKHMVK